MAHQHLQTALGVLSSGRAAAEMTFGGCLRNPSLVFIQSHLGSSISCRTVGFPLPTDGSRPSAPVCRSPMYVSLSLGPRLPPGCDRQLHGFFCGGRGLPTRRKWSSSHPAPFLLLHLSFYLQTPGPCDRGIRYQNSPAQRGGAGRELNSTESSVMETAWWCQVFGLTTASTEVQCLRILARILLQSRPRVPAVYVPTVHVLLRTHLSPLLSRASLKAPGDPTPLSSESNLKVKGQESPHVFICASWCPLYIKQVRELDNNCNLKKELGTRCLGQLIEPWLSQGVEMSMNSGDPEFLPPVHSSPSSPLFL